MHQLLNRPTVTLTALGRAVLELIYEQDALPLSDADGRDLIDIEIDRLLGLGEVDDVSTVATSQASI